MRNRIILPTILAPIKLNLCLQQHHPIGIIFSGMLMALTYLGGDAAQIEMKLPNAVTGVFQGMLLFFLLATDFFVKYRIRFGALRETLDKGSSKKGVVG